MLKLTYVNHFKFWTCFDYYNYNTLYVICSIARYLPLTIKILVVILTFELQTSYCTLDAQQYNNQSTMSSLEQMNEN